MTLVRAVGPGGRVVSYEIREEFARTAERNLQRFLGPIESLALKRHDIYEGVAAEDLPLDRIILDVPEPWRVVPHASQALSPGGIFLTYVPTVPQAVETTEALRASGTFALIETVEVLLRPWNIEGRSVRPVHRMVGHTGFLTTARRVQRQEAPVLPESADSAEEEDDPENLAD
jgi:tRNA (adenine57-N1/adenine58-N1)-methyltransferase catalytic subunit